MDIKNLSVEQRLARLEKSAATTSALVRRMYLTFYAAQIRRGNSYGRLMATAKVKLERLVAHAPAFVKLARVAVEINRGRRVVTLTKRDEQRLRALLRKGG